MPMISISKPLPAAKATGSIGDRVWFDANNNGIQDAGEAGVAGVTMSLVKPGSNGPTVVATTTTDANGAYHFNNLAAGSYAVGMYEGWGVSVSHANATSDDRDSDFLANMTAPGNPPYSINPWMQTQFMSLAAGQSIQTVDLGITAMPGLKPAATASIGDFVWSDNNANGIQDAGEGGLAGIQMSLVTQGGANGPVVVATTTTDSTGHYHFNNLAAGTYAVGMYELPGVGTSKANATSDDRDSDFSAATAPGNPAVSINPWVQSQWVALAAGQSNQTVDVGVAVPPWMQTTTLAKSTSVAEPTVLANKLAYLLHPADDLLHQAMGHASATPAEAAHAAAPSIDGGEALRQMLAMWNTHHAA